MMTSSIRLSTSVGRGPVLEQTQNVTGLNRLTGSQPQHSDNLMSN